MTNIQFSSEIEPTKICKGCKNKFPLSSFKKHGQGKKYFYPYCKSCTNEQQTKRYHQKRIETPVESLVGEIWRPVAGYEGLYEVSNYARIKRLSTAVPHAHSGYLRRRENLLAQNTNKRGYKKVIFSKNNKHKVELVHLVVWDAFGKIKRDGFKMVVDHKDNNKENNNLSNLQCVTQRVNSTKDRKRKHSKYTGVSLHNNNAKKWQANINIDGKKHRLGLFYTEEEASQAYQNALNQLQNKAA